MWSDRDGGWHEGMAYWQSYIGRFTWWADVMRVAMDVDAFAKPYFSRIGYYPMYLQPTGTKGGGFGDLNAQRQRVETEYVIIGTLASFAWSLAVGWLTVWSLGHLQ